MLHLVATPIGNLEDITYRAVRILQEVDFIICEDTRTSLKLLNHYGIKKPLENYHGHSDKSKAERLCERIKNGETAALISDAGTPGISDPGYGIIQVALEQDITLCPIPGPCAAISALIGSGMHMHHFLYLGFLPVKKGRQTMFLSLQEKQHSVVIYESVHRINRTLSDIEKYFGSEHQICVAREITKKFETFYRGTINDIQKQFKEKPPK